MKNLPLFAWAAVGLTASVLALHAVVPSGATEAPTADTEIAAGDTPSDPQADWLQSTILASGDVLDPPLLALPDLPSPSPSPAEDLDPPPAPSAPEIPDWRFKALEPALAALLDEQGVSQCAPLVKEMTTSLASMVHAERTRELRAAAPARDASAGKTYKEQEIDLAVARILEAMPRHMCRASERGTWSYRFDSMRAKLAMPLPPDPARVQGQADEPVDGSPSWVRFEYHADAVLVFRAPDGSHLSMAMGPVKVESADGMSGDFDGVDDLSIGDVDGDGVMDALVTGVAGTQSYIEGPPDLTHTSKVVHVANGAIGLVPNVPSVRIVELADVDQDGRADLLTYAPFEGKDEGNLGDVEVHGPKLAIHSLPGGRFSRSDAAAAAFARASCPARPVRLYAPDANTDASSVSLFLRHGTEAALAVACGKMWDVPRTEIAAWLEKEGGDPVFATWNRQVSPLVLGGPVVPR